MAQFEFIQWLADFLDSKTHSFEWDEGNQSKSVVKHEIYPDEAEEVFYDLDRVDLGRQISPVYFENRFGILGRTVSGKVLFIAFTIRDLKIRVISSRPANKKELELYEG